MKASLFYMEAESILSYVLTSARLYDQHKLIKSLDLGSPVQMYTHNDTPEYNKRQ